ncbi:hypothetical protein AA313_de0202286 [Arthrobotrys entomopaga]|nr:hypothetical protein AA313_de0202286 [Arthrobotrys entomopaga]
MVSHRNSFALGPYDVRWDEMFHKVNYRTFSKESYPVLDPNMSKRRVYKYKEMAVKSGVSVREQTMAALAGDTCVKILGHVYIFDTPPSSPTSSPTSSPALEPRKIGLTMEVAQPFYIYRATGLSLDEKKRVRDEMIRVVATLHDTKNMIHGDIKPPSFLKCSDERIVLCDFESARPADEDEQVWLDGTGDGTGKYMSPDHLNKLEKVKAERIYRLPATKVDDRYALAISVWELFTEKMPLSQLDYDGPPMENYVMAGGTVDVMEVEDLETREWIAKVLREGGAVVNI